MLVMFILFIAAGLFILVQLCGIDAAEAYDYFVRRRHVRVHGRDSSMHSHISGGIREARPMRKQSLSRDNTFPSHGHGMF